MRYIAQKGKSNMKGMKSKSRAVAAGMLVGTAISVALGISFWPGLLIAGIALASDAVDWDYVRGIHKIG